MNMISEYNTPESSPVRGAAIQLQNLGTQDTLSTGSAVSIGNRIHALAKMLFTMTSVAELFGNPFIFTGWLVCMIVL